jgi:hypothetical protein
MTKAHASAMRALIKRQEREREAAKSTGCPDPDCEGCRRKRFEGQMVQLRPGMSKREAVKLGYQKWGRGAATREVRSGDPKLRFKQVGFMDEEVGFIAYGQGYTWEDAHESAERTLEAAARMMLEEEEKNASAHAE